MDSGDVFEAEAGMGSAGADFDGVGFGCQQGEHELVGVVIANGQNEVSRRLNPGLGGNTFVDGSGTDFEDFIALLDA